MSAKNLSAIPSGYGNATRVAPRAAGNHIPYVNGTYGENFDKILIIGLGLIGGSFAKSCKKYGVSNKIYACDLDADSIENALKQAVIDDFVELEDDLSDFDLIVIATPLASYKKIFEQLSKKTSPKAIIIDLGSLKEFIIKILPKNLEKNFIACHPIAGSEKIGFENSSAELFSNKKFIICSTKNNAESALKKVEYLVKEIGFNVDSIDSKRHDEIYALVSHLPQFLSFLTKEFSPKNIEDEFFKNAFRLDNSDPEIWGDIFKLNGSNLEKFYVRFFENLDQNMNLSNYQKIFEIESIIQNPAIALDLKAEKFLEENFAAIFSRIVTVKSYLEIPEIKTFENYSGKGFKDFTSISSLLSYDQKKLAELIKKNQQKILKIFNSLS